MTIFRSQALTTIEEVKGAIAHVVERQKPGGAQDLSPHREEIDALLGSFSGFLPEWRTMPSVFRLARLEIGKSLPAATPWSHRAGIIPVFDNVVLPDVKHDLATVVEMLNFIRTKRGLDDVRMPLFLQPDEIAGAARSHREAGVDVVPSRAPDHWIGAPPASKRRRPLSGEQLRRAVHDRHGWRCAACGETLDLHLHRREDWYGDDDPEAYVTLCRPCLLRAEGGGLRLGDSPTARGFELEDDVALADMRIRSQLSLVFHKGAIGWVGFVFGPRYVVLSA
jgi:hypothetical protein